MMAGMQCVTTEIMCVIAGTSLQNLSILTHVRMQLNAKMFVY